MPLKQAPIKIKDRYVNPYAKCIRRTLFDALLWKMGFYDEAVKRTQPPENFVFPVNLPKCDTDKDFTIWMSHSSFFIKFNGACFLTDPVWSKRCSPFSFIGPKRLSPPPLAIKELKQIDCVMISHNHYDHLDKKTVLAINELHPNITWIVPLGLKKWFEKNGIEKVVELSWWQDFVFKKEGSSFRITATPTQHFSGRKISDFNKTLWCGFVVEKIDNDPPKRFYFVGDTGYNPHDFKAIGNTWDYMDLALVPIGSYCPKVFMAPVHIDPSEAVMIHKEVKSKFSYGMHWSTFRLSDEGVDTPAYELLLALEKEKISLDKFIAPKPGYAVNW